MIYISQIIVLPLKQPILFRLIQRFYICQLQLNKLEENEKKEE